ncbi:hypothetical protein HYH02_005016 [Chlamydomonas schloesseri]|uniref:Bifunctional inhibitor/plant lipid transfer protein/seed storage helical domain-containing protein n=1 Tax=Chlamydomonas schloesseri TaxID=2026947 RepID=A0A836B8E8_9CHLO|nr:hypothetical protein HYH02_005016 [Chlamydomonas schloesseri]|eukprot:KAG2450515.1 hypothetical protein HYH02_005016 [Chlamydomonas schloesseri]
MDRSRTAAAFGLLALLLLAAAGAAHAQTTSSDGMSTDALCKEAQADLPNNPDIKAFKQCAATKPISTDCCAKLAPYAKYVPCLSTPMYVTAVNDYLGGVTTIDEAFKQCAANKPITTACCQRVKPYSQYLPCLSYDAYRTDNFLAPLSGDEVMAACFSPP